MIGNSIKYGYGEGGEEEAGRVKGEVRRCLAIDMKLYLFFERWGGEFGVYKSFPQRDPSSTATLLRYVFSHGFISRIVCPRRPRLMTKARQTGCG